MTRAELERWVAVLDAWEAQERERASKAGGLPVLDFAERPPPVPPEVMDAITEARDPVRRQENTRAIADLERRITHLRSLAGVQVGHRGRASDGVQVQIRSLSNDLARLRAKVFL